MRASFVFSEVITGLRRNITMTIAMILTTAVSLAILGGGLLVVRTIDKMKANYLDDVEVSVYLTEDISANDKACAQQACADIRQKLESNPEVESVLFENRDAAFERFKRIFEGQPQLVQLARPESLPASLQVKLKDPARSTEIVAQYSGTPGVAKVDDQNKFLGQFFNVLNAARNLTFLGAVIVGLAALLLIAITVQTSAFTRRTEVGIMRLVGATRWYTQLPFLLEAVVSGVIGAVLAVVLLLVVKVVFIDVILEAVEKVIPAVPTLDVLVPVAPILLLVAVLISAATGYLTLRLYVRH